MLKSYPPSTVSPAAIARLPSIEPEIEMLLQNRTGVEVAVGVAVAVSVGVAVAVAVGVAVGVTVAVAVAV